MTCAGRLPARRLGLGPDAADAGGTRLVTRIHARCDWQHPLAGLMALVLMEFGDFAMLRRMLRGIKARAESVRPEAR